MNYKPIVEQNVAYLSKDEQRSLDYYIRNSASALTYSEAKIFRKKAEGLIKLGKSRYFRSSTKRHK